MKDLTAYFCVIPMKASKCRDGKMLYKTCVKTQQSAVIVEFGMEKNRAGNNMVFEKLPFQNVSRP